MIIKICITLLILNVNVFASNMDARMFKFLNALVAVESGGNDAAVGDGGRALGAFQIWKPYFQDAQEFDKSLKLVDYQQVTNRNIAIKVVLAYFMRYETKAVKDLNFEILARLHNAGPGWRNKIPKTDLYWSKVSKELYKF